MENTLGKRFPVSANDYKQYEEVGEGVSATVYRALCIPLNEIVAIKVLDLEKCNSDLDGTRREVQTMTLIDHPNVLRAHCSFSTGHNLCVVMPYMDGGSCLHIMKSAYPEGFEEPIIATLLRETLKALVYLHGQGHIHRDVKAGNILVDSNGAVKLADFGVSACMFDTGDRQRSRNTFVGTPCWMAPEVMQQLNGYDFKADIWSFGITALELAHGHAPFSKYPPMKVLLMTLQNAPPGLDYERDKRFSKSFKELVGACLVKDPKKRPSSEKLLKHHFFKQAHSNEYVAHTILYGLSPLGERFQQLKAKEADLLVQNKALYGDKEQLSQQEYIRGISAWNFNLEDLKNQAALIQDYDGVSNSENPEVSEKKMYEFNNAGYPSERPSSEGVNHSTAISIDQDRFNDITDLESSLPSFPIKPLEALKGCDDLGEDGADATSTNWEDTTQTEPDFRVFTKLVLPSMHKGSEKVEGESSGRSSFPRQVSSEHKKFLSGLPLPDNSFPSRKIIVDENRDSLPQRVQSERNYSGPLSYRQKETNNSSSTYAAADASEGAIVRKGCFKCSSNRYPDPIYGVSTSSTMSNLSGGVVLPSLQCILQQNTMQREEILKLIKLVGRTYGKNLELTEVAATHLLKVSPSSSREKELQAQVINLQQSTGSLLEELQKQKMKNAQLERQLNSIFSSKERQ